MTKVINVFRRERSQRAPLHARWGDVGITVPTEGSWSQFDNPHKARRERNGYGPGFVPDCNQEDEPNLIKPSSSKKSTTKRHHLSTSLSRMRSIAKRKDQIPNKSSQGRETRLSYKPIIDSDHMVELAMEYGDGTEIPPILYVHPSRAYYENLEVLQSKTKSTSPQVITTQAWPRAPWDSIDGDDDRSLSTRSSSPESQTHTPPALPAVSEKKKKKNRKSLAPRLAALAMVEEDEDLYG
ncbi:conserved hypothetical protein [Paecilomyces variotii No. 5]|uniref:Uncharacterized protein n=1 Tax=Byssochlamys spectabilis (strain No. 5 / NBRC 109023) TaxID=1356009 RepID=V5FAP3_BYSSN|nr:conserved hypothetical protein [Paecilomyces variotii No. 5]